LTAPVPLLPNSSLGPTPNSVVCAVCTERVHCTNPTWIRLIQVRSTLTDVTLPLGERFIVDMAPITRAIADDLNKPLAYRLAFMRNAMGRVILDRRYNTASMLSVYYGSLSQLLPLVAWDPDNPNTLGVTMPSSRGTIETLVTRRSQSMPEPRRIETSEYFRQTFSPADGAAVRVKASQCFTKYKWRPAADAEADGGAQIVATQVVSDFLTSFDDDMLFLKALGKPVAVFMYRMAFVRLPAKTM
jgi:hypothetical protein